MSCICQFHDLGDIDTRDLVAFPLPANDDMSAFNEVDKESSEHNGPKITLSASDLSDCRAENWLLKKKLQDYEVTIENLEQLVTTIVEKQHQILSEMFYLRKENRELQSECHLQREYHSMERNALMRELHDAQILCRSRNLVMGCQSDGHQGSLSLTPGDPIIKSDSSFGDFEEEDMSESDDGDQCDLSGSSQNSGRTSPSLSSSVSEYSESADDRFLNYSSSD
ncbi:uncharacterized protein LOC26526894 [Drosophila erecta]|uniref:Uncharacterized protein n=1 Tax=Drosophila erecta TaxID=7220 RepID=A0A0Q5VPL9_DROER|nr:uncharacterized protein LOC26526894 [Drosophila erecta]KQS63171.1 uncharacterized protein Dere_GG27070 [Drosophila erecta]